MENNPYAPPKSAVGDVTPADPEETAAEWPLYTINQITAVSFLTTGFSGAWLAAANFRAVNQPVKARRTLWLGGLVTIVTIALSFVLPDRFPTWVISLAVALGARAAAQTQFNWILLVHERAGGDLRSWWRAIGIALLILIGLALAGTLLTVAYYFAIGFE